MVLDKIVKDKRLVIEENKRKASLKDLESKINHTECNYSLRKDLLHRKDPGIIAEIKKKSPSRGVINENIVVSDIARGYQSAGVAAISVLTDEKYFGGSDRDLVHARDAVKIPILRKDFIIDEYQILEAKLIGADLILLIARILSPLRTRELTIFAKKLGLEVLLEIHNEHELSDNLNDDIDIVGVNNRDLDTLKIDLEISFKLEPKIPEGFVKISESGISSSVTLLKLHEAGYDGFLMGENFMKEKDPAEACTKFIQSLNS